MGVEVYNTKPTEWGKYIREFNGGNCFGKLNLGQQAVFSSHRSGWSYAVNALLPLHNTNGVKFDGFLEDNFAWLYNQHIGEKSAIIPYTEPWVGFFHNPPNTPKWFMGHNSLDKIIKKKLFKQSLKHCKGIYTLSTELAKFLRSKLPKRVPINVVYHPTEIPQLLFSFDKFEKQRKKKIVSIGYWLRRLNSIYQLPFHRFSGSARVRYIKMRLIPYTSKNPKTAIDSLVLKERVQHDICIPDGFVKNTVDVERLDDNAYDELLSECIVFLDLYDSSANNAVIECIARGTPIVVNRIPSTEEYLGKDYPLFFEDLDHAAEMIKDNNLILEAHQYLLNCDMRKKFSMEYFRNSITESEIYKSL